MKMKGARSLMIGISGCLVIDATMISQAVTNLIHNAADACTEVERPAAIRLSVQALPEGGALIAVDDSGPGVPEADRERIFDPYVTGKREGTGLGLAIVKKIVLDHGGSITVEESDLGGARFALTLPGSV